MREHTSVLIAGSLICLGLVGRFLIELSIVGDETDEDLEPKYRRIGLLNQLSFLLADFGLVGFLRQR